MALRHLCITAIGVIGATAALSSNAFAAQGDFNFTATLSQAAGSTTAITGSTINTTDPANFINYTNGSDSGQTDSGAGFGTAIVLASYTTTAADLTVASVASNYSDTIALKDITTGVTQMQTLTGSYSGGVGSNNVLLNQSYNQSSLTFTFGDGTYVISGFGRVSPGPPGGTSGSTGASVVFTSNGAPEPSALMLAVPGVLGMVGFARRRKAKVSRSN